MDNLDWDNLAFMSKTLSKRIASQQRLQTEGWLQDLADALGFDLVKRQTPQEAHDSLIAKRRAEDGQADETIGFR